MEDNLELECDLAQASKFYGVELEDIELRKYSTGFTITEEHSSMSLTIGCTGCNEQIKLDVIELPRINNIKSYTFIIQIVILLSLISLPSISTNIDPISIYILVGLGVAFFLFELYSFFIRAPVRLDTLFFWHSIKKVKKSKVGDKTSVKRLDETDAEVTELKEPEDIIESLETMEEPSQSVTLTESQNEGKTEVNNQDPNLDDDRSHDDFDNNVDEVESEAFDDSNLPNPTGSIINQEIKSDRPSSTVSIDIENSLQDEPVNDQVEPQKIELSQEITGMDDDLTTEPGSRIETEGQSNTDSINSQGLDMDFDDKGIDITQGETENDTMNKQDQLSGNSTEIIQDIATTAESTNQIENNNHTIDEQLDIQKASEASDNFVDEEFNGSILMTENVVSEDLTSDTQENKSIPNEDIDNEAKVSEGIQRDEFQEHYQEKTVGTELPLEQTNQVSKRIQLKEEIIPQESPSSRTTITDSVSNVGGEISDIEKEEEIQETPKEENTITQEDSQINNYQSENPQSEIENVDDTEVTDTHNSENSDAG